MSRSAARGRSPARPLAVLASKALTLAPHSDLRPTQRLRRRIRSPALLRRKGAAASTERRSRPTTPSRRWKPGGADPSPNPTPDPREEPRRRESNAAAAVVSARKLAAGMWHFMPHEGGGGGRSGVQSPGFESNLRSNRIEAGLPAGTRNEFGFFIPPVHNSGYVISHKLGNAASLPHPAMEGVTKWDPGCTKALDKVHRFSSRPNALDGEKVTAVAFVSALRAELEQAHVRINELEEERRSSKGKIDHFLRKLADEKASWRSREHEKIRAIIDGMKDDLNRERKNRQRMEIVNSKLVNELAEAKLSAKRYLQDYEKERKAREVMEEVCDELAKEIGDDKAEAEALKRESMKLREEVEEERKMLQMAEVWREERVQMKLIDAKVTLEEKYAQLNNLKADLEVFLRARSSISSDPSELREAELLKEAADFLMVQDIKEFSYQPPLGSDDIFSIFDELQPREENNEREIEPCYGYSPASCASKMHMVSPATDIFLGKPTKRYENRLFDKDVEDDSDWETVTHDEQGSFNSHEGSEPSVNGICEESNASASGTDWNDSRNNGKLSSEITELHSVNKRQPGKISSMSRLWRYSCPNNGENHKKFPLELTNGRISNGKISNGTLSSEGGFGEIGLSPPGIEQWSSPDSVNPHITRGMKGCIEWPRGMQKQSLKAKLLEARMESQKLQLRHALKQKI